MAHAGRTQGRRVVEPGDFMFWTVFSLVMAWAVCTVLGDVYRGGDE